MATIDQLNAALVKADAAGDTEGARMLAGEIRKMRETAPTQAAPKAIAEDKSMLGALGGAIGQGVGNVALGAQNLVGMGLEKLGADQAGQWLQKDAAQGKAKLQGEIQPYEEQYPMTVGGGRLAGEVIGTLPVGGALAKGVGMAAKGVGAAKYASPLVEALRTGGMSAGAQTGAKALATRVAGGAATGGASAALLNPEEAGTGAMIGGAIPVAGAVLTGAKKMISPERLMQSALKPTLAQQQSGEAKAAVDTLLKYGINATQGGADKLRSMVSGVDDEISNLISGSGKTVSKENVLAALGDVQSKFINQVSPTSDIAAIQNVGADFAQHPLVSSRDIPVELAQKLKQGTYKVLDKKYGQLGSAETEAQKGLARGLKEQIALAVPEVSPLNAKQSELIKALKVTSRRAMMDDNRNPVGIAGLSTSPSQLAAMLADRSALLKSLAARGVKAVTPEENNALINALREGVYRVSPVASVD